MMRHALLLCFCLLLFLARKADAQCANYVDIDLDDFEYTTNNPYVVPGTIYHLSPQTHTSQSGSYSLYMNFVNNLPPGTLVFDRPYQVCPGATYRFSAWFKETWSGSSDITLELVDGNGTILDTWTGIIGNATWFQYLSNPVVPTTGTLSFRLYSNWTAGSNDLSMDNLALQGCAQNSFSTTVSSCPNQNQIDLFDALPTGTTQSGNWQGPAALANGYQGTFNPATGTPGNYQYIVAGGGAPCVDDTFNVTVALLNAQLDLGPDTALCSGQTLTLDAGATFDTYQWQDGSTGQTFNVTSAGQYWCEVGFLGGNIVNNGDFEQGNTGFTTSYTPGVGGAWGLLSNAGTFAVSQNPSFVHNNFANCGDHTSGAGQMMIVNGATSPGTQVWCQTISIQPNTDYQFSTWVMSAVNDPNVAILQFSINGNPLGSVFSPNQIACNWDQFTASWNSGVNTTAQICILNQNVSGGGNDFCLDDIYFAPVCITSDTINVTYTPSPIVDLGPDTAVCVGDSATFDAQNPGMTYVWNTTATTQTFTAGTAGTYDVTVTDALGCSTNDAVNLAINAYPVVDLGNDTTVCDGLSLDLSANVPGATYLWNDNSTGNLLTVNMNGDYWVEATVSGCTTADTINVGFSPSPTINLGPDTAFCDGDSMTLDATQPGMVYVWNDNSSNPTLTINSTGTYWVEITDALGCSGTDTMALTVNPIPTVDLGFDITLCDGEMNTFTPLGTGTSFTWQDGSTAATYTGTATETIWVIADALGCTNTDTAELIVHPLPVFDLGPNTTLCEDDPMILDPGIAAHTYQWSTGDVSATIDVTNTPGTYTLTTELANCLYTDSITVDYTWFPTVILPNDTVICDETDLEVLPYTEYADNIVWQDGSDDANFLVTRPENLVVMVSNQCGTDTDSMVVATELCDCFMYIPNTFTPNADGKNDEFFAKAECDLLEFRLLIYNRWGELLFESSDLTQVWDGQYLGELVPDGVYVWRVDYRAVVSNEVQDFHKIGHVNVMK